MELQKARDLIKEADEAMAAAFVHRLEAVRGIAAY